MPGRLLLTDEEADAYLPAAQRNITDLVFRSLRAARCNQKTTPEIRIELYEKGLIMFDLENYPISERIKFLDLIVNACIEYDAMF